MLKGLYLLLVFFLLSFLLTLALARVMGPDGLVFWVFLYVFTTSQLFLLLHSILYWYYTFGKSDIQHFVKKRSDDFDKKTLVIISAFSEDETVLEPTFNAVKKSFNGPIMLAVDSPRDVRSYIELCKRYNVICLHRIHRSGFKAGAINNVVLNFLKHQHGYINQTKRNLSDEIVLTMNRLSQMTSFELYDDLQSAKKTLSKIDSNIKYFSNNYIHQRISELVSNVSKTQQSNDQILHSKIISLEEKIDKVNTNYKNVYQKLLILNKIIIPINNGIKNLSSDIESLQLETKHTVNQLSNMQILTLISKTDECLEKINNYHKSDKSLDQKNQVSLVVADITQNIDDLYATSLELKTTLSSLQDSKNPHQMNQTFNHLKKLQFNLNLVNEKLPLLCEPIQTPIVNEHIENITRKLGKKPVHHQQPVNLDLLAEIKIQQDRIHTIIDSLYDQNLHDNAELMIPKDTKSLHLKDLESARIKIENLEKKLFDSDVKSQSLLPEDRESLNTMVKIQRTKINEIDASIELLYEKNLYDAIQSISVGNDGKLLQIEDLDSLHAEIIDLQKDMYDFNDMTQSLDVINFIPDSEELLTNMNGNFLQPEKFLSTDNVINDLAKIEDLVSEFNYTVVDLKDTLPLNIEYIVLLDSDAHPKSDQDPKNNFFDLCAKHIQENDLLVFPQFYDKNGGPLVRAAYAQQVPFMKTIMPGRGKDNTAFMLGTNIMVKKDTLVKVGGFDDSTVTEDLATSMKIHEDKTAKSKYINEDVVVNGAPLSIGGYFTQQQRWAYGTYQIFFAMLLGKFGNELEWKRYLEYIYGNTWYFYGLAFLINALIPFYSIFLPGLIRIPEEYFVTLYLPYVFTGLIIFLYSVLRTGHGFKDAFYNMSLNAICFFTYIKAFAFILSGKKLPFEVTPKSGSSEETILRLKKISPILVVMGLLGYSILDNSYRIIISETITLSIINIVWASFFISLLIPILKFK